MTHQNNRKNLDRVILFEIGIIIALLFVNYALNLSYEINLPLVHTEENILEDQAFQLVELTEKKENFQEERIKTKEIAKLFDLRSMIKQVDDLFDLKINKIVPQNIPALSDIQPILVQPIIDSSTIIRDWADQMPEFPGGNDALNNYINNHFEIPDIIFEMANSVKVVTQFVVNENGDINNIKILHCSKPGFGVEEAVKSVYKSMPKWAPGMNKGRPSKIRMKQPLKIKIR
ncbi:MAG: energy transducer TonB [Bacteroidia bacterium]|nr:energy transducer TonB [Bacteroidia bacterium]|tara:strand:+ start:6887 stop:7579 length:693 start_codon:yes stop_codon:yes gene_type:complete